MYHSEDRQMDINFEEIYDKYYDCVYKYAYMLLLNRADAEDVAADTFMSAFENYSQFDETKASIRTWLTRIAHNRAVNLMRSAAYARRAELPETLGEESGAPDFADHVAAADTVLWLYDRLKPEERELLNMRYVMELKNREIGALLGAPDKTVNKRIQRLLVKCRILLNDSEGTDGGFWE